MEWSSPMIEFKSAPVADNSASVFANIEAGIHQIAAGSTEPLFTWFWPAMLGTVLAFSFLLCDHRETSRLVAGITFVAQVALVMVAQ
jgi:hypothetical protein